MLPQLLFKDSCLKALNGRELKSFYCPLQSHPLLWRTRESLLCRCLDRLLWCWCGSFPSTQTCPILSRAEHCFHAGTPVCFWKLWARQPLSKLLYYKRSKSPSAETQVRSLENIHFHLSLVSLALAVLRCWFDGFACLICFIDTTLPKELPFNPHHFSNECIL